MFYPTELRTRQVGPEGFEPSTFGLVGIIPDGRVAGSSKTYFVSNFGFSFQRPIWEQSPSGPLPTNETRGSPSESEPYRNCKNDPMHQSMWGETDTIRPGPKVSLYVFEQLGVDILIVSANGRAPGEAYR